MSTLSDIFTSFWELEEVGGATRNDSKGTNHLADTGTVAQGTGKVGFGADIELSGSQYLSIASNASLQTGDIAFFCCGWFKMESQGADAGLIGKWNYTSNNREYLLYYIASSDRFQFYVSTNGTAQVVVTANTHGAVDTGTWYFVMAWHNPTANTINICVNNGAVDTVSHSGGVHVGSSIFFLGNVAASENFDGVIDQAGFGKSVPTAGQITSLHNSGNGMSWAAILADGDASTKKVLVTKI